MLESDVETYAMGLAERAGWLIRKLQWIGRRNAPDRFCAHETHGVMLVEFKRPKKASDRITQDREIERLRSYGVRVEKVYTMAEARALFREQ